MAGGRGLVGDGGGGGVLGRGQGPVRGLRGMVGGGEVGGRMHVD